MDMQWSDEKGVRHTSAKSKKYRRRTVDKLPEEVLLAEQIMKVIGKRNPKIVLKAIMIVLKTTEMVGDTK